MDTSDIVRNRQAQRSVNALQQALIELMEEKPYKKISITELAERAGLTRSTFYAHYETKEGLLQDIVEGIIGEFFEIMKQQDLKDLSPQQGIDSRRVYFQAWKDNAHLIPILDLIDFDCLLIKHLKVSWTETFELSTRPHVPQVSEAYNAYVLSYLAYAFAGILREWFHRGMDTSVDVMAELLEHFTSLALLMEGRYKFLGRF